MDLRTLPGSYVLGYFNIPYGTYAHKALKHVRFVYLSPIISNAKTNIHIWFLFPSNASIAVGSPAPNFIRCRITRSSKSKLRSRYHELVFSIGKTLGKKCPPWKLFDLANCGKQDYG
jgi:hypothetical protein